MNRMLVLADQDQLDRIEKQLKELQELLKNGIPVPNTIGRYVPESEAKKLLGKGTTWFWDMRTKGALGYSKVGSTNYYRVDELEKLLDNSYRTD